MGLTTAGDVGFNLVFSQELGIVFTEKTRIEGCPLNLTQSIRQLLELDQRWFNFLLVVGVLTDMVAHNQHCVQIHALHGHYRLARIRLLKLA